MPRIPVFTSLRGYQGGWLRGDLLAGLTVWAVLVPESLAYAAIAGVSPVVGLNGTGHWVKLIGDVVSGLTS